VTSVEWLARVIYGAWRNELPGRTALPWNKIGEEARLMWIRVAAEVGAQVNIQP
jgi:hypothetical protein